MIKNTLGIVFYISLFLSFFSSTYSMPWTSSSMEFFALLACVSAPLISKKKSIAIDFSSRSILIYTLIAFSLIELFTKVNNAEKNIITISYLLMILVFSVAIRENLLDFNKKFQILVLACAISNVFVILSQYLSINQTTLGIWIANYDPSHGRPYGNFGQPNLAATFLLSGLCCSLWLYKKSIGLLTLLMLSIFIGVALAFPSSKTSFLSLASLLALAALYRDRIAFITFGCTSLTTFITKALLPNTRDVTTGDISTGRFDLWFIIIDAILKSPWTGYGVLNTRAAHFASRDLDISPREQVIGSAHNIFLDFMAWFGIPAGLLLSLLFIWIIIEHIKNNKQHPENIYLIFPILIHSQLEYPILYANFLLLFVFFLNINNHHYTKINLKWAGTILWMAGLALLSIVTYDYFRISQKYTELRFYNNNFLHAKKPEPLHLIALDITGGQYNYFLKDSLENHEDYETLKKLIPSMPSLKNYSLIIKYLAQHGDDQNELSFWLSKSKASFNEKEFAYLEKLSVSSPNP